MEDIELEEILKQVKIVEDMKVDPNDIGYLILMDLGKPKKVVNLSGHSQK